MKRDWNAMAQGILDAVGGPENISGMTHCASACASISKTTRLATTLRSRKSKAL